MCRVTSCLAYATVPPTFQVAMHSSVVIQSMRKCITGISVSHVTGCPSRHLSATLGRGAND